MAQQKSLCRDFQSGRCRKGNKCKFSHAHATNIKPRYCPHFAKGKCTYGSQCKFSHDPAAAPSHNSDSNHDTTDDGAAANYNAFVRWRLQVPKSGDARRPRPLSGGFAGFLQTARDLAYLDADTMQNVLTSLASEGGLLRLNELLDSTDIETAPEGELQAFVEEKLLPLFQIMSHDSVLRSIIVEVHRSTLLNHLYGINGKKAVRALGASVRYLSLHTPETADGFGPYIITLSGIYEMNSSAIVNESLREVTETLIALAADRVLTGSSRTSYAGLRIRLGIGSGIQEGTNAQHSNAASSSERPFTIEEDLPGNLSSKGQRHDNDSQNIADIQIMPTMEEIFSDRAEFLPSDDPTDWHLGPGMAGLIDRQFRLVREDTVGLIRDAAHSQLQHLMGTHPGQRQLQARTFVYEHAYLVDTVFTQARGLHFVVGIPQIKEAGTTASRRQLWWEESKRLGSESLVCLLGSDGLAVFLTVASEFRPPPPNSKAAAAQKDEIIPDKQYPRAGSSDTAFVILQLVHHTSIDIDHMILRFGLSMGRSARVNFSLVEFSGVLLPSFYPTLTGLQHMSRNLDVPFAELLAPDPAIGQQELPVPVPAYARAPGFAFDVSALSTANEPLRVAPLDDRAADLLSEKTQLDVGQAQALSSALSRSLALIQGPPGTGKSYTGVALMKVLLANRKACKLGPIILVTYTNHALDQSLCHLLDAGITQVVRIGSRSKSERLAQYNLRTLSQGTTPSKAEKHYGWQAHSAMEQAAKGMKGVLRSVGRALSEAGIMEHLRSNHESYHNQLMVRDVDEDGFAEARNRRMPTGLRAWLNQARPAGNRQADVAQTDDLALLSSGERHDLYAQWRSESSVRPRTDMLAHVQAYEDAKTLHENRRSEVDMRILASANVIGVTTSGLARNLKLLRRVNAKVLVVEEAGEVLEAQLLTAMLPSIEHAILIGDHQQLRPKAQNYDLSCEKAGSDLNFDVSLFERLVQPATGRPSVPYVSLEVQRRMHPSVSNLIRSTLYPNLQDAPSVANYPEVAGMRRRLFWFDHDEKEHAKPFNEDKTSRTNSYEVEMVFALVRHLVRQGTYQPDEIAVLTPYLGQLRSLKKALSSFTEVILNDRDIDELAQEDAGKPGADVTAGEEPAQPTISVTKSTLLQALRLATIDNFQGEEAQVVIISLVRSNEQRKCGFLKTSNRINVLLSRARHGMYIIGNSKTAEPVPMWHDVLRLLKQDGNVGNELELCCPRHPATLLKVTKPEDFAIVAPEAGCSLMCGRQLSCGHSCENKCHSEGMHNAVYCVKDCTRLKQGCTHLCRYKCGRKCDAKCNEIVTSLDIALPCGHHVTEMPCFQLQDRSTFKCTVDVKRTVTSCGHQVVVPCCVDTEDPDYRCAVSCGSQLPCGHVCKKKCINCRPRLDGKIVENHGKCFQRCGRDYTNCRHSCRSLCHGDEPCEACTQPCEVRCSHSTCDRKCSEPCVPCAEASCASACTHSGCKMPCAAPCDHVPCSKRCEKVLRCGHQCPSVCETVCHGEGFCQQCAPDKVKDQQADLLMLRSYREIDLSEGPCIITPCGHIYTLESLDGHMGMGDHYELCEDGFPKAIKGNSEPFSAAELKFCPGCRGSLRDLPRYGRIVRRALLDQSTKKFITWSNATYLPLANELIRTQDTLATTRAAFSLQSATGKIRLKNGRPLEVLSNLKATRQRYRQLTDLRVAIFKFAKRVRNEEQPFSRVRELVETARRRRADRGSGIKEFDFDQTILQTRGSLLASSLMIRTDVIVASDLTNVWGRIGSGPTRPELEVDFALNRENCEALIANAKSTMNHLQEVEGHIFWAHFVALECNVKDSAAGLSIDNSSNLERLKEAAERHLADAGRLCETYAGSTATISHEVDEVRRMLREQSYHSQMRMVVQAMATEFSGTGHWYTCANGHPFTVGECGMPMQTARCPQCDAPIGGTNHLPAEGVAHAGNIEREFGGMHL